MRPLRLTLQAFGPFAGLETVDFRQAHDARLFGIYGPTGAGKTSILDGLCFALFGESSGEERQGDDLRSHHAAPDITTEARLIFEVGERRYHIVRRPRQTVASLRGEGVTERPHWAALYDASDIELDDLTADNPGRVLVERRVEAVADQMRETLGYTAKQFRQVVLLPQGRFRQLLTAGTEDRSAVLRGLFDVGLYERLVERLKAQAQDLKSAVEHDQAAIAARLSVHEVDDLDALAAKLAEARQAVVSLDLVRIASRTARDAERERLEAGRALAEAFSELDAARQEVETQAAREPEVAALDARRRAAEQARGCTAAEARSADAEIRWRAGEADVRVALEAADLAETSYTATAELLAISNALDDTREAIAARVVTLRGWPQ